MRSKADVLIVGGGLSGCLTALRLSLAKPDLTIRLFEVSDHLGGDHTWSFYETDVSAEALTWMRVLIAKSWAKSSVSFPRMQRTLDGHYHTIRSEDLHRVLTEKIGPALKLNAKAVSLTDSEVTLENGDVYEGACVIDARGLASLPPPPLNGYHKCLGFDLRLENPHGLEAPVIMDTTCPQLDGLRFFSLFPWDDHRLLVKETYYSDTPELNKERLSRSIKSYAERRGWKILEIVREERGVLPIPMTAASIQNSVGGEPLPIGMRGGYFHATTGYSLPDAVRMADFLAARPELTTQSAREALIKFRRPWLSRQRFYRVLNRLLFYASEPSLRYTVLQRFYELPQDLIERFYAGRSTWSDRLRILSGKPPVPLKKAFRSLTERAIQARAEEPS